MLALPSAACASGHNGCIVSEPTLISPNIAGAHILLCHILLLSCMVLRLS